MITPKEYLMGRATVDTLPAKKLYNMADLLCRVNYVLTLLGVKIDEADVVVSGYRTPAINSSAGGATASGHLDCTAIDIKDPGHHKYDVLARNGIILKEHGLYMEHKAYTVGKTPGKSEWLHLDTKPRVNTIFIPYAGPVKS